MLACRLDIGRDSGICMFAFFHQQLNEYSMKKHCAALLKTVKDFRKSV